MVAAAEGAKENPGKKYRQGNLGGGENFAKEDRLEDRRDRHHRRKKNQRQQALRSPCPGVPIGFVVCRQLANPA